MFPSNQQRDSFTVEFGKRVYAQRLVARCVVWREIERKEMNTITERVFLRRESRDESAKNRAVHNEEQKGGASTEDHVENWKVVDEERKTDMITARGPEVTRGGKMKEEKPRN